jgi:cytochrome c-type biogenesis protein CcmH
MNFWILAVVLLAITAILISWPLITGGAKEKVIAFSIVLMTPLAGILLYQSIGTPEASNMGPATPQVADRQQAAPHADQQGELDGLVASLQQRLNENPDDPQGWLILGRTLKTMERYAEAETALANANRLIADNPMIKVELAESMLFASGQPTVSPAARRLIEEALEIDPEMQKGLWLMGMAYSQDGDQANAIAYWQKLMGLLDPASGAASAVTQQIERARQSMGGATAPVMAAAPQPRPAEPEPARLEPVPAPQTDGAFRIPVTITLPAELAGPMPPSAALFVFVHASGGAGMPLAVKRLSPGALPLSLQLTDDDLLRPGMSLADFEKLDVSARISMSGVANAASGDYQANRATVDTKAVSAIALNLDQRVP